MVFLLMKISVENFLSKVKNYLKENKNKTFYLFRFKEFIFFD